jgi:DHA2 family multidrug resistance protein-like MFS transporter
MRKWVGLAVLCLPTMLAAVDVNVMFLALPHVSADLGAGATEQLWITDIYGFMISGFLVTMGTVGDRIGRRRLLLIGAAAFIVSSLFAAYSTSSAMLIGSRALIGVAGATIMPSVLALIRTMFTDPKQMNAAIGVWGTAIMAGIVLGPVVGGLLLGAFWWGSIFLMAVPIMALLLVTGPFLVPESRNPAAGRVDLFSVALSLGAILPFTYGLKEITRHGPGTLSLAALLAGIAFLLIFLRRQRELPNPLLDLALFRIRVLSAALTQALMIAFVMGGIGLMAALFLQMVKGLSPLQIGLWMLGPSLAMILMGNLAPMIARKVRPAYVLGAGSLLAAVGMVVLTQVGPSAGLPTVLIGLVIVYVGGGSVGPMTPFLVMSSAPPEKAGSVGSLASAVGEFGVALGVAVLGLIGGAVYRAEVVVPPGVPASVAAAARESVAGAVAMAPSTSDGGALLVSARAAFTSGLHAVAFVAAFVFIGLAVLAYVGLRHIPATGLLAPPTRPAPAQRAKPRRGKARRARTRRGSLKTAGEGRPR